jgi:L-threonylcarbamoyladenylate synthase
VSAAADFDRVIAAGGVVLFPSDTVYGLACDPDDADAIDRLYTLKARPPDKAAAIMFFALERALTALPELGETTQWALRALMPGGVMVLLPNPRHRFPLACRADPHTLGLRVVSVAALDGVAVPVLQSSANPSGAADARRLQDVAPAIRAGASLEIDGGELPGVASTVIDLRAYETQRRWTVVREGLVSIGAVATALGDRQSRW